MMLRLPQFLDSRLPDDGDVVSITRRPRFTPLLRKILGTHFSYVLSPSQGLSAAGRIM
jgi:hypothetical protein